MMLLNLIFICGSSCYRTMLCFGSDVIEPIIVGSDVIEPMIVGGLGRYHHV